MLQQVCECLRNYFIKVPYPNSYTISGGTISPAVGLKEGQRFWLVGSDLNDGVYTYHEAGIKDDDDDQSVTLRDEEFGGTICAMAVPDEVIRVAAEAKDWVDKYGDAALSPYSSENVIGVYSYQKKGGGGAYDSGAATWQDAFKTRLDRWRKVCL